MARSTSVEIVVNCIQFILVLNYCKRLTLTKWSSKFRINHAWHVYGGNTVVRVMIEPCVSSARNISRISSSVSASNLILENHFRNSLFALYSVQRTLISNSRHIFFWTQFTEHLLRCWCHDDFPNTAGSWLNAIAGQFAFFVSLVKNSPVMMPLPGSPGRWGWN